MVWARTYDETTSGIERMGVASWRSQLNFWLVLWHSAQHQRGEVLKSWQVIFAPLQAVLDHLPTLLADIPSGAMLSVLLVPLVIAAISRRLFNFLGASLLAIIPPLVLLKQTSDAPIFAAGAYIGSLIVALSGIAARRRDLALLHKMTSLRAEVNQFAEAESRRFLVKLKSHEKDSSRSSPIPDRPKEKGQGSD
jgi:hypothetical protein